MRVKLHRRGNEWIGRVVTRLAVLVHLNRVRLPSFIGPQLRRCSLNEEAGTNLVEIVNSHSVRSIVLQRTESLVHVCCRDTKRTSLRHIKPRHTRYVRRVKEWVFWCWLLSVF